MSSLSLRARLTIWYVMALVAILTVFAAGVLALQRRVGRQRIDGALDATAAQLTNMLREELRELDAPKARRRLGRGSPSRSRARR